MTVGGSISAYTTEKLSQIQQAIADAAKVSKDSVTVSASAGMDSQRRRLSVSTTAVVIAATIFPSGSMTTATVKANLIAANIGTTPGETNVAFAAMGVGVLAVQTVMVSEMSDCPSKNDGHCDDGGPGSEYDLCPFGTDYSDCGNRNAVDGAAYFKAVKEKEDALIAVQNANYETASVGQPYLPSFPGEPCYQMRSIHVSGRSPTTDVIAFSPKYWPVEQHPVTKEDRQRLAVLQSGCELSHDDYTTCYSTNAFDASSPNSNTKKYELYRASRNDYIECAKSTTKNTYYSNVAQFGDQSNASACRWKASAKTKRFMQPVDTNDPKLMADVTAQVQGCENSTDFTYDYAFEICHNKGTCTANSFDCIPAYTVVAVGDPYKGDQRSLFAYDAVIDDTTTPPKMQEITVMPVQNPIDASGPMASVFATPAEGPYFPCATNSDGLQLPCDDGSSKSLSGLPPPDNLTVYVSDFAIKEVPLMSFDQYAVSFTYTATWSDRYAVHPCTINLYDTGKGVGANGKLVKSDDWWVPAPKLKQSVAETISHSGDLRVMHGPSEAVASACTLESCPWPKQLFLQEKIQVMATKQSSWDLAKHPFDTQVLKGKLTLVSNIAYSSDIDKVAINFTESSMNDLAAIYAGSDWDVKSAKVMQDGPLDVSYEIKMRRASASVIFKVFIPVIAISLLTILASTLAASDRLLVVSVSVLTGSTMLDPDFLGLPPDTQGVPFLMALVIGHMAINCVMLVYSLYIERGNFAERWKLRAHQKRTQAVVHEVHERAFARARALASDMSIIGDSDKMIEDSKEKSSKATCMGGGVFKRSKAVVGEDDKTPAPSGPNPDLDTSDAGQIKRLTELMWLMPMLIGQAVHGNADDPPVPLGPVGAYDLNSADAQEDADELGQRIIARVVPPAYVFTYFVIILVYFA